MQFAWRLKEVAHGGLSMLKPGLLRAVAASVLLWLSAAGVANAATPAATEATPPGVRPALAAGNLGMFPAGDFRLVSGACTDCATLKEALWYFRDDLVAVPNAGVNAAGFTRGVAAQE